MRSKKIMIIDDNQQYALRLVNELDQFFSVDCVSSIADANARMTNCYYDLILLDIDLGSESGFDFAIQLKNSVNKDIPIIYLTATNSASNRITGYSLGAEDFIQKSTDTVELMVRIKNVLSRNNDEFSPKIQKHGIIVNLLRREAKTQSSQNDVDLYELNLSPTEFNILVFFMRHEGQALSRHQILDAVWNQKLNVSDRTIDAHISTLRKKLNEKSYLISSVFGIGYRFGSDLDHNRQVVIEK